MEKGFIDYSENPEKFQANVINEHRSEMVLNPEVAAKDLQNSEKFKVSPDHSQNLETFLVLEYGQEYVNDLKTRGLLKEEDRQASDSTIDSLLEKETAFNDNIDFFYQKNKEQTEKIETIRARVDSAYENIEEKFSELGKEYSSIISGGFLYDIKAGYLNFLNKLDLMTVKLAFEKETFTKITTSLDSKKIPSKLLQYLNDQRSTINQQQQDQYEELDGKMDDLEIIASSAGSLYGNGNEDTVRELKDNLADSIIGLHKGAAEVKESEKYHKDKLEKNFNDLDRSTSELNIALSSGNIMNISNEQLVKYVRIYANADGHEQMLSEYNDPADVEILREKMAKYGEVLDRVAGVVKEKSTDQSRAQFLNYLNAIKLSF